MSKTLSEFASRHISTYINGEHLTYADICYRMYKLVEDNYGKCKDGHFGFSMKEYKKLTENDIYNHYYVIVGFYYRYLDRMEYYKNNLERIRSKKNDRRRNSRRICNQNNRRIEK